MVGRGVVYAHIGLHKGTKPFKIWIPIAETSIFVKWSGLVFNIRKSKLQNDICTCPLVARKKDKLIWKRN